jgi:hypothetical protein
MRIEDEVRARIRDHLERTHDALPEELEAAVDDALASDGDCSRCGWRLTVDRARVRDGDERPFVCDLCGSRSGLVQTRCPGCGVLFGGWRDETGDREGAAREV